MVQRSLIWMKNTVAVLDPCYNEGLTIAKVVADYAKEGIAGSYHLCL